MPNRKAILVTGGAGFIGSHVCKSLAKAGYLPVVYDNLSSGRADFVKWGPLVIGDIRDENGLLKAFKTYAPLGVIHMAALIDLRASMKDPASYYDVNLAGSITLFKAMQKEGIHHCIFSSTAAIFGIPENSLINELTPENPMSPYGRSKWMVEQVLKDFGASTPLRFVSLRYFNAAGADPEGEIGETHSPPSHLIPIVLDKGLSDKPFSLFGQHYPTRDGSAIRDYVHVTDLAEAHVKALEYLREQSTSLLVNLGSGHGYTVLEVVKEVEKITGKTIALSIEEPKAGDPPALVCHPLMAQKILGWIPKYSSLSTMVETSYAWQKKQ
jgi:UDP-arabinose 4-epimerase